MEEFNIRGRLSAIISSIPHFLFLNLLRYFFVAPHTNIFSLLYSELPSRLALMIRMWQTCQRAVSNQQAGVLLRLSSENSSWEWARDSWWTGKWPLTQPSLLSQQIVSQLSDTQIRPPWTSWYPTNLFADRKQEWVKQRWHEPGWDQQNYPVNPWGLRTTKYLSLQDFLLGWLFVIQK